MTLDANSSDTDPTKGSVGHCGRIRVSRPHLHVGTGDAAASDPIS